MKTLILIPLLLLSMQINAQDKFFTRDGFVSFFSSTKMEDISAENKKVSCIYALSTQKLEFAVLMKSFHFEKALMEEHFNENYVESEKFPKAVFKGNIVFPTNFTPGSKTDVKVKGTMSLHGVSKEIEVTGTIERIGENIKLVSQFYIVPENYNIAIPGTVRDNIAKEIKVNVQMNLQPFKR